MAQNFPRWLGSTDDLPTGMYTTATESGRLSLSCPQCSSVFELPPKCGVDQAGLSQYAIHCEGKPACSWWSFAVFESRWERS